MGSRLDKNSHAVRKRIEDHTFTDETGEEYEPSAFGGFPDYFRRKKIKLQNLDAELRASAADKPQIFAGVVAHVTGYTQPPLHVLHRELVQHGAGFLQYLDSKTMATHIIASSLPPKKAIDFNKYRIVKPAWVTDSIQANKLLPWSDYRVLEETPRQKTLRFDGTAVSTQSQQSPSIRYREQTNNSFYTSQLKGLAQEIDSKHSQKQTSKAPGPSKLDGSFCDDDIDDDTLAAEFGIVSPNPPALPPAGADSKSRMLAEMDAEGAAANTLQVVQPDAQQEGSPKTAIAPTLTPEELKMMTSEQHNALLLQDPRMRKSSTANPDFIQQYYSESRLHHLSTWKAELKSKMQKLAAEKGLQGRPPPRKPGSRRYILHVDFDSFFCAVSLKSAPEFVHKPTVVAHGNGTGSEIASCNYPAREHGVKNGMWMKRAKELYPDLKVLPYDFPGYEEASKLFYESILDVGGVVQSVSIDEALIDATAVILQAVSSDGSGVSEGSIWREQEKADQIAHDLRERIKQKTGCAVSVGIGGNILLAKVALRKGKPAGQHQIKPDDIHDVLGALKVESLPGVAYSIAGKLEEIGIKFVNDIRQTSKERLIGTLGPKTGEKLFEYARGIDRSEVGDQPIRKSVSAEVNWGIRFINQEEAEEFLHNLCKELEKRLLHESVKGKQLTLKVMRRSSDAPLDPPKHLGHGPCDTFNKSVLFGVATHDYRVLGKEAVSILRSYRFSPGDLRGLGVQLTKLEPIKLSTFGPDGSQKRLSFGAFKGPNSAKKAAQDPIQEASTTAISSPTPGRPKHEDPITEDPLTPRKPRHSMGHPALALAKANEKDAQAKTPLNVAGTQFVMPSNPDPSVLAELPQDIRSRLMNQGQPRAVFETRGDEQANRSRTQSPALANEIPPEFDPEVFNALPEDMKAEILAAHRPRPPARQAVLPQSPRKDRQIQHMKKTTPTKRRVPNLFMRGRERQADAHAKVVQTNLFAARRAGSEDVAAAALQQQEDIEELDPTFLAELPEDVRKEVVADHRRRRAQKSGLDIKLNNNQSRRNINNADAEEGHGGQARLTFPGPPAKASFTSGGLSSLAQVRDMLRVWHRETVGEGGPHRDDVDVFLRYVERVVIEERDMDKAAKLARWLDYLVEEDDDGSVGQAATTLESTAAVGREAWRAVVADVKNAVQSAVKKRGFGTLDLG